MQTIAGCMMILAGMALAYTSGFDNRTQNISDNFYGWIIRLIGFTFFWLGIFTAIFGWLGLDWGLV